MVGSDDLTSEVQCFVGPFSKSTFGNIAMLGGRSHPMQRTCSTGGISGIRVAWEKRGPVLVV